MTPGAICGLSVRLPLRGDQLVKPADFPLDRLQAVPLQLEGVTVHAFPCPRQTRAETLQPLLEPGPPASINCWSCAAACASPKLNATATARPSTSSRTKCARRSPPSRVPAS